MAVVVHYYFYFIIFYSHWELCNVRLSTLARKPQRFRNENRTFVKIVQLVVTRTILVYKDKETKFDMSKVKGENERLTSGPMATPSTERSPTTGTDQPGQVTC